MSWHKFRDKKYDILVSTTVVEVGVDVPNATVMLIEGADRFGLAQLHQLRGRVGRGAEQSYCLLIPTHEDADRERTSASHGRINRWLLSLQKSDLQIRGPGEFLGTRQAGYASSLRMASITDVELIEKARTQAQAVIRAGCGSSTARTCPACREPWEDSGAKARETYRQ
ncbi:MAG: hypothetical protein M0C28_33675 [Candidatus Moduliflexus flocculans]|nr:hypothetical protein [Candidatus Moduliflexus flocculans]